MRRRNSESVDEIVARFLRAYSLEAPLNECRVVSAWGEVAGPAAERYTQDVQIRNRILYVKLSSAVLRSELVLRRSEFVRQLNSKVGVEVITDIHFV